MRAVFPIAFGFPHHPMRAFACFFAALMLIAAAERAPAQTGAAPLVRAALVTERAAVKPGETVTVALRQTMTPGWHTYWLNPGDSGEPTTITWTLPPGFTAGPLQWPLPEAIPIGPLVNYGYAGDVLLLTHIKIPQDVAGPSVTLAAHARWLVCKDICVPEEQALTLTLPLIDGALSPRSSPHASAIAAARKALPVAGPWPASVSAGHKTLTLDVALPGAEMDGLSRARFFPVSVDRIANAAPQKLERFGGGLRLRMERSDPGADAATAIDGVLAIERTGPDGKLERRGFALAGLPVTAGVEAPETQTELGLGAALLFAFLGGLILNLMPCVFPVLSLKAYSLARDAEPQGQRRLQGFAYLAGVLTSFAALAAAVILLRAGGAAIGWGVQFQSPLFVLVMAALFLLLGLNMSGVYHVAGGALAGAGGKLAGRAGPLGAFFTGVLATIVATPCTAPFMGAATGYAFAQPAIATVAVLMTLGLGFAAPILLLSLTPAAARFLPKPGAWMDVFKQVMAFPLYATAAWFVWILSVQQGSEGVLAAMVTLIGVAFAAWLFGLRRDPPPARLAAALALGAAAVVLGASVMGGAPQPGTAASRAETAGPVSQPFTRARLESLQNQSRPVFINLTAAWCITCKVNERVALQSERVAKAFAERDVAYLKGDWTKGDPEVTALLKEFGRAGVPLYLLYSPKAAGLAPRILPQILTESLVLDSLAGLPASGNSKVSGAM